MKKQAADDFETFMLGTKPRGITSQKSVVLIFAMVRASNVKPQISDLKFITLRDVSTRKTKRMQCKL
jgi:hypothetical protein